MATTVTAFPRLHQTLIDLGSATPRVGGGIGFAIDGLPIKARSTRARHSEVSFREEQPEDFKAEIRNRLVGAIERANLGPYAIEISSTVPPHNGFGSKTTILLASITAMSIDSELPLSEQELIQLSGRGGMSRIGVSSFFRGGIVVDSGHLRPHDLRPSSRNSQKDQTPTIRLSAPDNWMVTLLLGPGRSYHGKSELAFFQNNTPIDNDEVFSVLSSVYHGLVPGYLSQSIDLVANALSSIHQMGFKKLELSAQHTQVRSGYSELTKLKYCASGLSSMGPLLYAICDRSDVPRLLSEVEESRVLRQFQLLGTYRIRDKGYGVERGG